MEKEYRLTKEKLDSVRDIEGFPIGEDEDIISLSNPPYYTACPNPFIKDFIEKNGKKYNEITDDYHREPFAADVSEGKTDPIYMAHSYHTKVPYKAIMRYILHYTDPGDIVLDGFCGSGMTGVAAQMCGNPDDDFKEQINSEMDVKWGARKAILSDLSPIATFITSNYNNYIDVSKFQDMSEMILKDINKKIGWVYETHHKSENNFLDNTGEINYTIWSDVFICPSCSNEYVFWDVAVDKSTKKVLKNYECPNCKALITKTQCDHAMITYYDKSISNMVSITKQVPVLINYSYKGKRYEKRPDKQDLKLIENINDMDIDKWHPNERMCKGSESRRNDKFGMTNVHHFFTKRNLYVLSEIYNEFESIPILKFYFTSIIQRASKLFRWSKNQAGPLTGTMYIASNIFETSIFSLLKNKKNLVNAWKIEDENNVVINTGSSSNLSNIYSNSIDYIFTDPPFGDNLNYSELSFMWESWLKVFTNQNSEAVMNKSQNKSLPEYQDIMTQCFKEYYRVLKPGRWMTVEFHNSKNAVWNAIQEALQVAGFVIADIRTLDKKQGSFKQVTSTTAVKQDLIISAYKPKESMIKDFKLKAGTEDSAWSFVREHLSHLPVVVVKNKNIELIAERQAYLLYDRMLAYHIMRGYSIPMDASDFYNGLDEKFIERDGMYFLANQINEYDAVRIKNDIEPIQMEMFVNDEKSAIAWLYKKLEDRKTYQELQPEFMQEVRSIDKREDMPELLTILEENFLKDEDGKWYIPDRSKKGDIEKLRNKNLIKEFESYFETDGKLKIVRTEAVRAGFAKLWNDKDYKSIVDFSERIHESIIQEDDKLLMYYDLSLGRIE